MARVFLRKKHPARLTPRQRLSSLAKARNDIKNLNIYRRNPRNPRARHCTSRPHPNL